MSYIGGFPHLLEPQDFIDPNCTKGIQWIWFVLRECAVSPKEITAVTMGLISTVVWIMFAIPQIVENYRRGIPDQAISPFLLLCFIIGDSLSLTGCFLTNQLVLQVSFLFVLFVSFYKFFRRSLLCTVFFVILSKLFNSLTTRPNTKSCLRVSSLLSNADHIANHSAHASFPFRFW